MADITSMIEAIKGMTVMELSELVKAIEEEFGVSAAATAVAVAADDALHRPSSSMQGVL